jgi:hypothetical protein
MFTYLKSFVIKSCSHDFCKEVLMVWEVHVYEHNRGTNKWLNKIRECLMNS